MDAAFWFMDLFCGLTFCMVLCLVVTFGCLLLLSCWVLVCGLFCFVGGIVGVVMVSWLLRFACTGIGCCVLLVYVVRVRVFCCGLAY